MLVFCFTLPIYLNSLEKIVSSSVYQTSHHIRYLNNSRIVNAKDIKWDYTMKYRGLYDEHICTCKSIMYKESLPKARASSSSSDWSEEFDPQRQVCLLLSYLLLLHQTRKVFNPLHSFLLAQTFSIIYLLFITKSNFNHKYEERQERIMHRTKYIIQTWNYKLYIKMQKLF